MKKNIILVIALLFSTGAIAAAAETKILKIFSDLSKKHALFLKDEMQNRQQLELFANDVYEPATKDMMAEIEKGNCKACMAPYLKSLIILDGSMADAQMYNLKELIQKHPQLVAEACEKTSGNVKKKIASQLEASFEYLAAEKTKPEDIARLKTKIKACFQN